MRSITVLFFLSLLSLLLACTSQTHDYECGDSPIGNSEGRVFLMGTGLISKNVFKELIEISGIKNRGYSVFLTSETEIEAPHIKNFLTTLKQNKVLANHIVAIGDSTEISPSQQIAIGHANLLFIAFSGRDDHEVFLHDSGLVNAIRAANEGGAVIIALGAGADLMGEITVVSTDDSLSNCRTMKGLGLAKAMLVDKTSFFENHKTWVQDFANDRNFNCVGIGEKSLLKICSGSLIVIKPQDMIAVEQGVISTADQLKEGQLIESERP